MRLCRIVETSSKCFVMWLSFVIRGTISPLTLKLVSTATHNTNDERRTFKLITILCDERDRETGEGDSVE